MGDHDHPEGPVIRLTRHQMAELRPCKTCHQSGWVRPTSSTQTLAVCPNCIGTGWAAP